MAASGVQSSPDWGKPGRGGNKTSATSRSPETEILRVPPPVYRLPSTVYCPPSYCLPWFYSTTGLGRFGATSDDSSPWRAEPSERAPRTVIANLQ